MLRVFEVSLKVVERVRVIAHEIAVFDRDQARQHRRSCLSIALNISEASRVRGGNRRLRYQTALGSAEEARANLRIAAAAGYTGQLGAEFENELNQVHRHRRPMRRERQRE